MGRGRRWMMIMSIDLIDVVVGGREGWGNRMVWFGLGGEMVKWQ